MAVSNVLSPFLQENIRDEIELTGDKDGSNQIFLTPGLEKFISDSNIRPKLYFNSGRFVQDCDFTLIESGGVGTGFDGIKFTFDIKPIPSDQIFMDYIIDA